MKRLGNKPAIITGAALGIGKAAAIMFAKEGAKVAVTDILDDEAIFVTGSELVIDGGYTAR